MVISMISTTGCSASAEAPSASAAKRTEADASISRLRRVTGQNRPRLEEYPAAADRLRGEQGLAIGAEQHRMRETDPHQMEREEPIVDPGEGRPPHHHPIDLEAFAADVVEERFEQLMGMGASDGHRRG